MKSSFYVEFSGNKVLEKDLVEKAKLIWKENGNKVKDLNTLEIYFKPDENNCYYVFNETTSGKFSV